MATAMQVETKPVEITENKTRQSLSGFIIQGLGENPFLEPPLGLEWPG
jgi:hypothetical protein